MPPNPTILAFDTSAAHCAAALLSDGRIVNSRVEAMARGQAERLMPLLSEILEEANKDWSDVDGLGVGTGPGNFTGIRISVSAARGLALGLAKPAIGVSALEAQAFGLSRPVISCIDAKRDRAYMQTFGPAGSTDPIIAHLTADALRDMANLDEALVVGDVAASVADFLGCSVAASTSPLADAIALIAANRLEKELPRPAPLYIREADAAPPRDLPPTVVS